MSTTRRALAVLALAAVAAIAVLLGAGALSGTRKAASTSAPACLPTAIEHSAQLPGLGLYVSPAPQTNTANPDTQISLLGIPASEIRRVSAVGRRSGPHPGRLLPYSQGDGASFVPARPFHPDEQVTVRVTVGSTTREFAFRTDTPYPTGSVAPFPNPQAPPADYQSFATLPGVQAPVLTVTLPDRDPAAGDIFTTNGPGPGRYGPLIYSPQGRLVWFEQLPNDLSAENLSVQAYQGQRDLTYWQGRVLSLGFGEGEDMVLGSHYQVLARVKGANGLQADLHDFQIAPHDEAFTTAFNAIRCNLLRAGGSRNGVLLDTAVQEIDMRTGLARWEWHSLDHVAVGDAQSSPPKDGAPWDSFHINSIDPEPDGDLLISARSTWAAYQLQGGTGTVLWRLGGTNSSFAMGPGTKAAWQHDARMLPNGEVTLFDDGSNPPVHSQSRAVRIALDMTHRRATLSAAYLHPTPLLSASQGNMQTLADGNIVVGYGGVPQISEYAPNGSLLLDAHLPLEMSSYRAYRFPWQAQPAAPPAATASLNNTGEETIVRASWNGATELAGWRVLAGSRPSSLTAQVTLAAKEFESSMILPKRYAYVAVQALDQAGRVIGSSQPVAVTAYAAAYPGGGAVR
jgi:arylsulfotransferase ASST